MALKLNIQAPDFTLPSTNGTDFRLSQTMQNRACVLYFYPKDFTPGCTAEACSFRDQITQFHDVSIDVIGISRDSIATHLRFQETYQLPFTLLSDTSAKVAKLYQAYIPFIGLTKRITYLLDKNHTIVSVYENLFGAKKHIQEMVKQLDLIDEKK